MTVRPHPLFKREGDNIFLEQPISFVQAVLGGVIEVPTLEDFGLKIPEERRQVPFSACAARVPRLHGHGRGDQLVRVKVQIPTRLNAVQREAVHSLAAAFGEEIPEEKGFFGKVRDAFGK